MLKDKDSATPKARGMKDPLRTEKKTAEHNELPTGNWCCVVNVSSTDASDCARLDASHPGIGQYNYTVPEQALPFLQKFQRPLVNPPTLPKAP